MINIQVSARDLVAGLYCLALLVLLLTLALPPMKPEVWAAWVQAVGSVIAIGAAIVIASWQASQTRAAAHAELGEVRGSAYTLMLSAEAAIRTTAEALEAGEFPTLIPLERVERALIAFPTHTLRDADLVGGLAFGEWGLATAVSIVRDAVRTPDSARYLAKIFREMEGEARGERIDFARRLSELGHDVPTEMMFLARAANPI